MRSGLGLAVGLSYFVIVKVDMTTTQAVPAKQFSTWAPSQRLDPPLAGDARSPHVAMSAAGDAIAVWHVSGSLGGIWSARLSQGQWQTPERVASSGRFPHVAMSRFGTAVMVWHGGRVWGRAFTPGSGWSPSMAIDHELEPGLFPKVALDPEGNAVAVWQSDTPGGTHIWANRFERTRGWGDPVMIQDRNAGTAGSPDIALDAKGNAIAVWHEDSGLWFSAWSNRFQPVVGWGRAEPIAYLDAGNTWNPQVGFDSRGNAWAVWAQHPFPRLPDIWVNQFDATLGWSEPHVIERREGTADLPRLAVGPEGSAVVLWRQTLGGATLVFASRFDAAAARWETPILIQANDQNDADDYEVAMDGGGNAVAVWRQADGARLNIWANRFRAGRGWGRAEMMSEAPADGGDGSNMGRVALAVDRHGNAVAVWTQFDGSRHGVWSSRSAVRTEPR